MAQWLQTPSEEVKKVRALVENAEARAQNVEAELAKAFS